MANVGVVYIARQLASATAFKLYVCVVALYALGRLVWVEQVFHNWANVGVGGTFRFLSVALLSAEFAVQLTLAALIVAGVWFVRDLTRMSSSQQQLSF